MIFQFFQLKLSTGCVEADHILNTFLGIIFAKDGNNKEYNPCNHPLIRLAESKGLKAVPLKDIIKLRKLIKECEKSGGKDQIKKLYENDWKRDYKKS